MELKDILYDYISQIIERKKSANTTPLNASMNEVTDMVHTEVKEALNTLIRDGKLKWNPNINGIPLFTLA